MVKPCTGVTWVHGSSWWRKSNLQWIFFPLNGQNLTFSYTNRPPEVCCSLKTWLRHAVLPLNQNEHPSKRLLLEELRRTWGKILNPCFSGTIWLQKAHCSLKTWLRCSVMELNQSKGQWYSLVQEWPEYMVQGDDENRICNEFFFFKWVKFNIFWYKSSSWSALQP